MTGAVILSRSSSLMAVAIRQFPCQHILNEIGTLLIIRFSPSVDGVQIKVVFIETQYINIDAVSFKSVVQRLTGKDSAQNLPPSSLATLSHSPVAAPEELCWPSPDLLEGFGSAALPGAPPPPVLDKLSSFRDFERMLSQLPPLEDVYQFLDDL